MPRNNQPHWSSRFLLGLVGWIAALFLLFFLFLTFEQLTREANSALLLGDKQAKARFGETFSERALSSRAGEMVKRSNKRYCADRMPDKARLKASLMEQFGANKVDSVSDMYDILAVELSCYRSPRTAGTPSDVTP